MPASCSPHYRLLAAESGIRFVHTSSCRIMCSLALLPTHTSQPFRAVDRNIGIRIFRFQSGSSLQSPAFLRVDPCCFSGRIIFFFQKGCGGCICMVLFFPQNPFSHFSVQPILLHSHFFLIYKILYASFFGFIFLKGIADVSSGVSIGG